MMPCEYLQRFSIRLTTQGLVHIGDGNTIPKRFYLLNHSNETISYLDEAKLFSLLIRKNQVDRFETYCMESQDDFSVFCKTAAISPAEQKMFIRATFRCSDALDVRRPPREIHSFIRNAQGQVYVPGSSIKGALRTALLFVLIQQDNSKLDTMNGFEERYLHTLQLVSDRKNALNSIMRGVLVSDSEPIPDTSMCLSEKFDAGAHGGVKKIPLCRECIAPGQVIHASVTLDQSVLHGQITKEGIMEAICTFFRYYQETYMPAFTPPTSSHRPATPATLYLGGGAGAFSKTLCYPYEGKTQYQFDLMRKKSPHTMKYGRYDNAYYAFGPCKVEML